MPFKSKAQMRLFFAKEKRGELPKGTTKRWARETKNISKLPQRKSSKKANVSGGTFDSLCEIYNKYRIKTAKDVYSINAMMQNPNIIEKNPAYWYFRNLISQRLMNLPVRPIDNRKAYLPDMNHMMTKMRTQYMPNYVFSQKQRERAKQNIDTKNLLPQMMNALNINKPWVLSIGQYGGKSAI
jgi:hypothetical protein